MGVTRFVTVMCNGEHDNLECCRQLPMWAASLQPSLVWHSWFSLLEAVLTEGDAPSRGCALPVCGKGLRRLLFQPRGLAWAWRAVRRLWGE